MHSVAYLHDKVRNTFDALKIHGHPAELYEPIQYGLTMGGKRIRPFLTLLACDLFEGDPDAAIPAAIGLEMFHNFTLVHDDIMDHALLRRGHLPVYLKWDTNTAILAGDTIFTLACEYLNKTRHGKTGEMMSLFYRTAREVCEGQQMDLIFEKKPSVQIEEYLNMIRLKTAVLLGCCLKTGGLVAGAGDEDADLIYQYGQNLGMAFQLQDDLLDTFGTEATFGKKTGGDIVTNKKTYLFIKASELANESQRQALLGYYSTTEMDNEVKIERVKTLFTELHIQQYLKEEMEKYYQIAQVSLSQLSLGPDKKEILLAFGEQLMNRTY